MNSQSLKLKSSRNIILAALILLLGVVAATAIYTTQSRNETAVINTLELTTIHPTYASIEEMIAAPDVAFVGRAVVLDDGKVRSRILPGTPAEAPPEVLTDYQLDVQSVIKGQDTPSQITIAVMGGLEKDTRYVYENVPNLKKGDTIIVFASLGDDGKYYPMSGSTAIAVQKADGSYSLGEDTIGRGGDVTFTEQDIAR